MNRIPTEKPFSLSIKHFSICYSAEQFSTWRSNPSAMPIDSFRLCFCPGWSTVTTTTHTQHPQTHFSSRTGSGNLSVQKTLAGSPFRARATLPSAVPRRRRLLHTKRCPMLLVAGRCTWRGGRNMHLQRTFFPPVVDCTLRVFPAHGHSERRSVRLATPQDKTGRVRFELRLERNWRRLNMNADVWN